MIIEDIIIHRVANDHDDKIHDLLSCGKEPETKDILPTLELSWYIKNNNKRIDTSHIFNRNKIYKVSDIETLHISWKCYRMIVRTIEVNINELDINKESITVDEFEAIAYQCAINNIKKEFPKSDIFFKTLLTARAGDKL